MVWYISEAGSFELWNLLEYIKGRKKGLITVLAGLLANWLGLSDLVFVNMLLGFGFEMLISLAEFYFKEVEVEE